MAQLAKSIEFVSCGGSQGRAPSCPVLFSVTWYWFMSFLYQFFALVIKGQTKENGFYAKRSFNFCLTQKIEGYFVLILVHHRHYKVIWVVNWRIVHCSAVTGPPQPTKLLIYIRSLTCWPFYARGISMKSVRVRIRSNHQEQMSSATRGYRTRDLLFVLGKR